MSFAPSITIGAQVFNSVGAGRYLLSTVSFGQPQNSVLIKPGSLNRSGKATSLAVTRRLEKDVTVGSVIERRLCDVQLVITTAAGFTVTEMDTLLSEISTFIDATTLNRILNGEN